MNPAVRAGRSVPGALFAAPCRPPTSSKHCLTKRGLPVRMVLRRPASLVSGGATGVAAEEIEVLFRTDAERPVPPSTRAPLVQPA